MIVRHKLLIGQALRAICIHNVLQLVGQVRNQMYIVLELLH